MKVNEDKLREGDPAWVDAALNGPQCEDRARTEDGFNFICTLPPDHEGEHVAHSFDSDGATIVARWDYPAAQADPNNGGGA